jgi:hypothetical protein
MKSLKDGSMMCVCVCVCVCDDSIMKPTKHCFKMGGGD